MKTSTHPDFERADALLRAMMPGSFRVTYVPDMPRRDGTPARWFQVVFAVGPGEAMPIRSQIHALFPQMLATLSQVRLATDADLISLRARRFSSDSKDPAMFIEADGKGSAFRAMQQSGDFSAWAGECQRYHNHFDNDDQLTRQYARPAA